MKAPLNCNPWPIGGACALTLDAVSLHSRCLLHCLKTRARLRIGRRRRRFFKWYMQQQFFFIHVMFFLQQSKIYFDHTHKIKTPWMRKTVAKLFAFTSCTTKIDGFAFVLGHTHTHVQLLVCMRMFYMVANIVGVVAARTPSFGTVTDVRRWLNQYLVNYADEKIAFNLSRKMFKNYFFFHVVFWFFCRHHRILRVQ